MRRMSRVGGFAWRIVPLAILLLAVLAVLAHPIVSHEKEQNERREIVKALALITMAKTAYAVDHDTIDGKTITPEQLISHGRKMAQDTQTSATERVKYLTAIPDVLLTEKGKLDMQPIGSLPTFELKNGDVLTATIGSGSDEQSAPW